MTVPGDGDVTISVEVLVWASAEPGEKLVPIEVFYQGVQIGSAEVTVVVV